MSSTYQIDRSSGKKASRQQLLALREKWPRAFPDSDRDIRPLAVNASSEIAAAMGWSLPYTLGVLDKWKMSPVYCEAVLHCDRRINLDGTAAEPIDQQAKDLATKRLAQLAARKAAKKTMSSETAAVKPTRGPTPARGRTPEAPEQLRSRVRASLLRRRSRRLPA